MPFLYCEEDREEYQEIPPGMEDDNAIDRFLIDVMDSGVPESSTFHRFFIMKRNNMSKKPEIRVSVDNLCCFRV